MRKINPWAALAGIIPGAALLYAWRIEPRWLRVAHRTLAVPDLPPAFEGYRIAQLSDLHLGVRLTQNALPRVVEMTNREAPDLVVLTGDIATAGREGLEAGAAVLSRLEARDGVWAILGNHDYFSRASVLKTHLADAGITLLRNEHRVVTRGADRLVLAGMDDVLWGLPDLPLALRGAPEDAPVILLAHEPDYAPAAAENPRVVLQLSGHAHGGQVRLPGLPPLLLPDLGRLYPEGAYQVGGMALYVSTGVGTGRVVLRFNCRPEIAVITLVRGEAARGVEWIESGEGV